ncbi:MAG: fibronectin type III domain-containing protein [Patescibacteria group bacterium]
MSKKVKIFAIVVVGLAIVIFVASTLGGKKGTPAPSANNPLSSSTGVFPLPGAPASSSASSDEFSTLLSNIKHISIDTSLFDNAAYKLLRDYPVSLGSDIVGRANPFAPIGSDGAPGVQPPLIQTIQPGKVTSTTAELGAQITLPDTVPTSVVFEYGTTDVFGSATPPVVVVKSTTTLVTISNLSPDTLYYVRAVAVRGSTSTIGNTNSFTTTKK